MDSSLSPRLAAIHALHDVIIKHRSLANIHFTHPLSQEICYGTIRWYFRLIDLLKPLLSSPLSKLDEEVQLILISALYQLLFMQAPSYAVVNESVNMAKKLRKSRAANFINAVLRNFLRQQETLITRITNNPITEFSHPKWLYQKIIKAWPNNAKSILTANNQRPPFTLRINVLRAKREDYLPGKLNSYNNSGITLDKACNVTDISGFHEGKLSVQDNAAQFAAALLDAQAGEIILDACAAPGGKTAHILEIQPNLQKLIALDIDEQRLQRIQQNLTRLQLNAELICGDAAKPIDWWNGEHFDRILLDAPCSATGVIRRHPDIKLLRQEKDISALVKTQQLILTQLWPLLKPGGTLLYATCSILPEENNENIAAFLQKNNDASEKLIDADWGVPLNHGRQILPGMEDMDGFYYCCLVKNDF